MYARQRYCPDVARARTHLTLRGVSWTEYDIEADAEAHRQIQARTGQSRVPTLIIGDEVLIEPTETELDDALITSGLLAAGSVMTSAT